MRLVCDHSAKRRADSWQARLDRNTCFENTTQVAFALTTVLDDER